MDREPECHGLLVLDKPGGITSRDAVDRALRWFPRGTRIGHTGTLDPLATGVLVLGVGTATRLTEYVQQMGKTYRAGLLLGARSDTDDADGTVTPVCRVVPPVAAEVRARFGEFVGAIDQVPPAFSAAKVTGRRAYDLARRGREVVLQPRRVRIDGIDLLAYAYPRLDIEVRCGKGTYIRSLARDLGERLGCGALVQTLRRTRVGPFDAADAVPLEADAQAARRKLLPLAAAVGELPRVSLADADVASIRQGQAVAGSVAGPGPLGETRDGELAGFDARGNLVGILRPDARGHLRPVKVLPQTW
jgi:tRNA pseudouridine55 synthase